jgi:hypothetical protein
MACRGGRAATTSIEHVRTIAVSRAEMLQGIAVVPMEGRGARPRRG